MSLIAALNISKSALAVQQAAMQVTSNNVANAGSAEYTRQVARTVPVTDSQFKPGVFMGNGVNLIAIERQIDEALEGRIRGSVSDGQAADARQQWIGRVEAVFHELGDDDLSSQLSTFFNGWSNLANNPQDMALRQIVLQNGNSLASMFQSLRSQLDDLQADVDQRMATLTDQANALADQVAQFNGEIVMAEAGVPGSANALNDQRDAVLRKLSELIDIKTQDTGNGVVNVMIGSDPLVIGTVNRGIAFDQQNIDGGVRAIISNKADKGQFIINSGQLGALVNVRSDIDDSIAELDNLAGSLVFELNKIHASGQGIVGFSQASAANTVADSNAILNTTDAALPFTPVNGSLVVHVRQKSTGLSSSTLIDIDLDGLNANDTTLNSLAAALDAVNGISATASAGKLRIASDSSDIEFTFSQDSSGVLAALGINSFFTGKDARTIAVASELKSSPGLLAAAKNGQSGDNQTAVAIVDLETQPLSSLGGVSLKEKYESLINGLAVSAASAKNDAEAAQVIQTTLLNQREALSGVSLDEEAVNLMRQQRAFQGAARIIAAVDELLKTLIELA